MSAVGLARYTLLGVFSIPGSLKKQTNKKKTIFFFFPPEEACLVFSSFHTFFPPKCWYFILKQSSYYLSQTGKYSSPLLHGFHRNLALSCYLTMRNKVIGPRCFIKIVFEALAMLFHRVCEI